MSFTPRPLNYRSAWVVGDYAPNDVVMYNGKLYICTVPTFNTPTIIGSVIGTASGNRTLPAGCAAGDLLFLSITDGNGTTIPAAQTGFTSLATHNTKHRVSVKALTSTDIANNYVTLDYTGINAASDYAMYSVRGLLMGSVSTALSSAAATITTTAVNSDVTGYAVGFWTSLGVSSSFSATGYSPTAFTASTISTAIGLRAATSGVSIPSVTPTIGGINGNTTYRSATVTSFLVNGSFPEGSFTSLSPSIVTNIAQTFLMMGA